MPFIRLSDTYIDHPKFLALSASAFRLWHEGMAFCRKHQTDGLIPLNTLQGFRYYQPVRVKELAAPYQKAANPLWETVEGFGYKVHDYLFWNLSKEEEEAEKDGATSRMRALRKRRRDDRLLQAGSPPCSPEHSPEHREERSPNVRDRAGTDSGFREKGVGEKPPVLDGTVDAALAQRAGDFVDRYRELYRKYRHGATLRSQPNLDWTRAVALLRDFPEDRLDKIAVILLTTDEEWVSQTDRGFGILLSRASWCDGLLAAHEAKKQARG